MNLSEPFIHRPVLTILLMVAIILSGLFAYSYLPISSMPNVSYPTINVKVSNPGSLPETMAETIALPLEKQFMAIPGLRLVSSNNTLGSSSITLQFEVEKNMLTAIQDVQQAITSATPFLPPNLPYGPTYKKYNPAEQNILTFSLTSDTLSLADVYTYASTLVGQRLSMLSGVSQVTAYGSILAVRIQVDPGKLASHNLTMNELSAIVRRQNVFLPTGQLDGKIYAPIINVDGQLLRDIDYDNMIVAYRNGKAVRIQDLGKASRSFQNNKIHVQYADANQVQPSVTLAIQKQPEANTAAVADQIFKALEELKGEIPPAINIRVVGDRSVSIRAAIEDANFTLALALFLVVFVIFLFFGKFADTIIPSLVLPMSVIGTYLVIYLLGYTLNNLTVLALTLAIGFIVDDAVVVLENIVRLVEEGRSPLQAALEGSSQICFTIISMSLSLVAVFIPMLFMGGLIGKVFHEFAVTLCVITFISGIISLTLTPMLCSRFIPPRSSKDKKFPLTAYVDQTMHSLQNRYHSALISVMSHRKTAFTITGISILLCLWLLKFIPTDFLPDDDVGVFVIYTQEKEGGSSHRLLELENQLIEIVRKNPYVFRMVAISSAGELRKGLNIVRLKPIDERPPIQEIIQKMYQELKAIDGLQCFIKNVPLIDLAVGQESKSAYQLALRSIFTEKIYESASKLVAEMKKDPIFQGVNSDLAVETPQIYNTVHRDKASSLGVTVREIESTFNLSYSGSIVSRIQTPTDQYNVILELLPQYQRQKEALNSIWLRSSITKELLPLTSLVSIKEGVGTTSVNHINQFPAVTLSFNLAPNVPLETALQRIEELAKNIVDPSVSIETIGAAKTFNESIRSAGFLLLVTIFVVYIILGILYESFFHQITILTTLPPATLGGLLVLALFGLPLSLYSFLGIIMLIGIVQKNGIMVVDFALENMRLRGMAIKEATIDACLVRFRPIMMTTIAAIFGVLPIALGHGANAAARRPLGLVIIGGLMLSQLITLFITPILHFEMESLKERISKEVL